MFATVYGCMYTGCTATRGVKVLVVFWMMI